MQNLRSQSRLAIRKPASLKTLALLVISKSLRRIRTISRGYPFLSAWIFQSALLLPLILFLSFCALAADYPPADHQGADFILQDGDRIWGLHENVGTFEIPVNATINVHRHHPETPQSGFVEIHAHTILIRGTFNARGAGYKGGDGGNGGHGENGYPYYRAAEPGGLGFEGSGPAKGLKRGDGGYNVPGENTDLTTDSTVLIGSGGGGGDGGDGGTAPDYLSGGGGGGGAAAGGHGGGRVRLFATNEMNISGLIDTRGVAGGNGNNGTSGYQVYDSNWGSAYYGGTGGSGGKTYVFEHGAGGGGGMGLGNGEDGASGQNGGAGGGGGIFLYCETPGGLSISGVLAARGGRQQLSNGGTVKMFYKGDYYSTGTIYSPRIYYRNLDVQPTPTPTPTPTPKGIIFVPEDYSTIQEAIYAATHGTEIIVSPGTYNESIYFLGKNILLRSSDPSSQTVIASTIIKGNRGESVVTFSGTESDACVLDGFTITNGYALNAGGINGRGSRATIRNNHIKGNIAYCSYCAYAGGISDCDGIIEHNTISDNSVEGLESRGGGLFGCDGIIKSNTIIRNKASRGAGLYDCDGTIRDNSILGNSGGSGAGLYGCDGTIHNNTISGNSAVNFGGGLSYCDGTIQYNIISANVATFGGGGLAECNGTIRNNTISDNQATHGFALGGGLYECAGSIYNNTIKRNVSNCYAGGLFNCNGSIQNNTIYENSAIRNGGGLGWCDGTIQNNIISYNSASSGAGLAACDGTIQNNTILGNSAQRGGGGLYRCTGTIRNCIIWQNTASSGPQLSDCAVPSYSCIQGWTVGGTGNIFSDPQLVDPDNGDFHLLASSPCIDAGCYIPGMTTDFEGEPRPWNGTSEPRGDGSDFDIGADEFIFPIHCDFMQKDGWTTGTAETIFTAPEWTFEQGRLKLVSQTNTNTFGFWVSPENAIPVSEGYLYRARFVVSTDVAQPELVPQIRLRVNSSNFQQADCLTIDSSGDGGASPTPEGTTYDLYFVPPTNVDYCMLAFDLLNFNPYDAAHAELALESVLVERFRLDTLDESTTITWTYDFESTQEFWFPGDGTYTFTDPEFFWDEGALHLRSMTNTNTFGFWHSDGIDVIVEENRLYRGTFEVRTDEPERSFVPQMRLRFNTANMQAARTLEISSIGDGANSPGTTNTTYDRLYFLPPANCVGRGLIVSFDILNFSPDDAAEASLILDRAIIETLSPPTLP